MVKQSTDVEQLWYTWSDIGLDTIRAGFRIRAASAGLQDYRSLRVQDLDRYQRYALPPHVNPVNITLEMAPVCLALIDTGQERILVHRAYAGRDGVGRYGSFFIHLLAGLGRPEDFSAKDAISLWRSPFWQVSDDSLTDRRSTDLNRISLQALKQMRKEMHLDPQSVSRIQAYLPYVIQAYLTKKPFIDETSRQTIQQKLYIAASDDDVARLIFGLICCLPEPFVKDLTFSTYEHDLSEAATEIVGTCWLSVPGAEKDPHVADLLPANYYSQYLAINCYTGVCSPLANNPLVSSKPLAERYAQHATRYFLHGDAEFQDFLETASYSPNLDVDALLNLYESMILRAENPSAPEIDSVLTSSNLVYVEKMLSKRGYQAAIINRVLRDPEWWLQRSKGRVAISRLREHSAGRPVLAQALSSIARSASPLALNSVREALSPVTPQRAMTNEIAAFSLMVDVMSCAAPPTVEVDIWVRFLQELFTIRNAVFFLNTYVYIQKNSASFIEDLFQQLVQYPQQWPVLQGWFMTLAAGQYSRKLRLLFILLRSAMGQKEANVLWLLQHASFTTDEAASFLETFGPKYLPSTNQLSRKVVDIFGELAKQNAQQEKMRVLLSWFASAELPACAELSAWLDRSLRHLETLLEAANLNVEESGQFLAAYGEKYFKLYSWSTILWKLFENYAASGRQPRLSFIWLSTQINRDTFERGLRAAQLTKEEKITFLERYGEYYLARFPRSGVVLDYVQEYLDYLRTADLALFQGNGSPDIPSPTERCLLFLSRSSLSSPLRQESYAWYVLASFVRKPSVWKGQLDKVGLCITQLQPDISPETYEMLIEKLARAYLEDTQALPAQVSALHATLSPRTLLLLVYHVAGGAGESLCQGQETKPLFVPCIQFALNFRTLFPSPYQQDVVQLLLETLLLHVDEKTFKQLQAQEKKWPPEIRKLWQDFQPEHIFPPASVEPSRIERLRLWWERRTALRQMRKALKNRNIRKIVQVDTDYLVPLNSYPREVPPAWWSAVDKALHELNPVEEAQWQQYEDRQKQPPSSSADRLSRFERMKLWWQRTAAFTKMRLALRSKHIGTIVRVATEQMAMLDTHTEKVPPEWWRQIDAAFEFFTACEDAYEGGDESTNDIGEQVIVKASHYIDILLDVKLPAPRLTLHEKMRAEAAKQYVAYIELQKMKATNKDKMLSLSTVIMPQVRSRSKALSTEAVTKRGFLGFGRK